MTPFNALKYWTSLLWLKKKRSHTFILFYHWEAFVTLGRGYNSLSGFYPEKENRVLWCCETSYTCYMLCYCTVHVSCIIVIVCTLHLVSFIILWCNHDHYGLTCKDTNFRTALVTRIKPVTITTRTKYYYLKSRWQREWICCLYRHLMPWAIKVRWVNDGRLG